MHEKSIGNKCYALAYDDKFSQNVNISETIDDKETIMNVNLFSKKNKPIGYPSWKPTKKENPVAEVGIDPDNSNNENAAVIWLKPNTDLDYVYLMHKETSSQEPDKYTSSQMIKNGARYEIIFLPSSVLNPFNFYFKYRVTGQKAETLIPGDTIGNKNVYEYKH